MLGLPEVASILISGLEVVHCVQECKIKFHEQIYVFTHNFSRTFKRGESIKSENYAWGNGCFIAI